MASEDPVDALLAAFGHDPDDEAAAVSARARGRRHWLRQRAAESCTMAGVLLTLAERGDTVTLRCGPWTHRGRVRSVTKDLALAEIPDGIALLPVESITAVEAPGPVVDDRSPAPGPGLFAVLAAAVPERPAARLLLEDGTEVAGTLTAVGKDVASVRLTSAVVTVRLSALAGVVLSTREK